MVSPHPKSKAVPDRGSPVGYPKQNRGQKQQTPKPRPQKCLFPQASTPKTVPPGQHRSQRTPRLAERAHSLPCSPAAQQMAAARHSLTPSPKSSLYASSKCYEPPTPESLPVPPSTWVSTPNTFPNIQMPVVDSPSFAQDVTEHLKLILKVQA